MLIDSHCHIHNANMFEKTSEKIISDALKNSVSKITVIGTSHEDSLQARDFAAMNNTDEHRVFWSYGIHPENTDEFAEEPDFSEHTIYNESGEKFITSAPIAIGEVGLDYHYSPETRDDQIKLLERMIDLAQKNNLPLIFHVREAFPDFFGVVDNFPNIRGVVHSFTDNKKNLARALERGFYIGVNGIATYSTLPLPPLERVLTETDAPFLAPVPFRGKINEPAYIKNIVDWLSEQYQVSPSDIEKAVEKNSFELFGV